jgi:beta-glucanase (GH16 family)
MQLTLMKMSGAAIALACLLGATACVEDTIAAQPVGPFGSAGYVLAKDWDFKSRIRDIQTLRSEFHTRYVYANGTLDHLNDEWSRYRDNNNHVFTPNGLALVARSSAAVAAPGAVESGMLRSQWSGTYGLIEAKVKVPRGLGLWPAFWLNPQDARWPPEIDIMEIVNNGRDTTRYSFHFVHGNATQTSVRRSLLDNLQRYTPGVDYADGFHVFSVEWTPDIVRHFVDGLLVVERAYRWRHDDGGDAGPAHVLINLAVGGQWPGPPAADSLPARLEIEYIRVFRR